MNTDIIELPGHDMCTGCGACIQICPVNCISFKKDDMDAVYPYMNKPACIGCGYCIQTCHINNNYFYPESKKVYAGWSYDDRVRRLSASGGIASSIYRYGIQNNYKVFGVALSKDGVAEYIRISTNDDILKVQNSKYVFSYTRNVYGAIRDYLNLGEKVIFIGLPCQVAGLLGYLGSRKKNLILIDIICHGTCPEDYLQQHIRSIDSKFKANRVLFRDPSFGTNQFVFSLYCNREILYSSIVHGTDVYQLGYHKALIYRENCYNCKYACKQRVGDITISDFSGLGKIEKWDFDNLNISCVICSSQVGDDLLSEIADSMQIILHERPPEEAFLYEKQLNSPSQPHIKRDAFVREYKNSHDFESILKRLLKKEIMSNRLRILFRVDEVILVFKRAVPTKLKKKIKRIMSDSF